MVDFIKTFIDLVLPMGNLASNHMFLKEIYFDNHYYILFLIFMLQDGIIWYNFLMMDNYFKKEIRYSYNGTTFKFDVGNTLFSTFDLDHGTDILLRSIDFKTPKTILDLGCGVGLVGLFLSVLGAKVGLCDTPAIKDLV